MTISPENVKPGHLTVEIAREWVRLRVSEKRFAHIAGVASTGSKLAKQVGYDPNRVELAGWLHDSCKEVKDQDLVAMAREFGLKLHPIEEVNGHLLHGPVAAQLVRRLFVLDDEDLLNAIAQHTLGAVNMSVLSKVMFLADALEPGRPSRYSQPIWEALGQSDTGLDLDKAIFVSCQLNIQHLLDTRAAIHPKTIDVRNYYLEILKKREVS